MKMRFAERKRKRDRRSYFISFISNDVSTFIWYLMDWVRSGSALRVISEFDHFLESTFTSRLKTTNAIRWMAHLAEEWISLLLNRILFPDCRLRFARTRFRALLSVKQELLIVRDVLWNEIDYSC